MKKDTDREWEKWGQKDPYYGVITVDKYRNANLDEEALEEFFESGREHIRSVLTTCRSRLDPDFDPRNALDFGCGTGRLLIPLAEQLGQATGIDVSDAMLREAQRNIERFDIGNARLLKSDDELTALQGEFDLLHSFIVFQHIPVDRGRRLFQRLLEHLSPGGIAALHLTYGKSSLAEYFGFPPSDQRSGIRKFAGRLKRAVVDSARRFLGREKHAAGAEDPEMQMNPYHLNELLYLAQTLGVRTMHLEFTDHTGDLGVYLYFQKPMRTA